MYKFTVAVVVVHSQNIRAFSIALLQWRNERCTFLTESTLNFISNASSYVCIIYYYKCGFYIFNHFYFVYIDVSNTTDLLLSSFPLWFLFSLNYLFFSVNIKRNASIRDIFKMLYVIYEYICDSEYLLWTHQHLYI